MHLPAFQLILGTREHLPPPAWCGIPSQQAPPPPKRRTPAAASVVLTAMLAEMLEYPTRLPRMALVDPGLKQYLQGSQWTPGQLAHANQRPSTVACHLGAKLSEYTRLD